MLSTTCILITLFNAAKAYDFQYTPIPTDRWPMPLPSPLPTTRPYAPGITQASTLLQRNLTYTTYSYQPSGELPNDGKYGQSAYNALWASANLTFSSTLPFTTTATATPIPSSDLVFPPPISNLDSRPDKKLPSDFIWGVAGSAFQIEGGLYSEGRGPAALDYIGATAATANQSDGLTNNMNYFLYKQDIARLAALGLPYYSFSISWSRILPFGVANSPINQQSLDHYDDVIETCIANGITPMVTLVHFDFPTTVSTENDTMINDFIYYSKIVMAHFADRVPIWVTFNEPNLFPTDPGMIQNVALAHAEVYHWYKSTLNGTGSISIKLANNLAYPLHGTANVSDIAAARRYQDFMLGILANPIYLGEQIPSEVLDTPGYKITPFTAAQIDRMNGTSDFFAIDAYTAQFASPAPGGVDACISNASNPLWPSCAELSNVQANGWLQGAPSHSYVYIAPTYVRQQLKYIWDVYRPSGGIMVTEFGFPVLGEANMTLEQQRFDLMRSLYYREFLDEMVDTIFEDGVKVIGALGWSFLDNNEFGDKSAHFGMQIVRGAEAGFERVFKRSIFDFVDFFTQHVE